MSAGPMPPDIPSEAAPAPPEAMAPTVVGVPATVEPIAPENVNRALWNALLQMATRCAGAQDTRESKEAADATFSLAQAITMLDRGVISPQGVTPDVMVAAQAQAAMQSAKESTVTPDTGRKARENGTQR